MSASAMMDKDHPCMIAWKAYKETYEYNNTRKWALYADHVDGSLWAAFEEGFRASQSAQDETLPKAEAEAFRRGFEGGVRNAAESTVHRLRYALQNCVNVMKRCNRPGAENELTIAYLTDAIRVAEMALTSPFNWSPAPAEKLPMLDVEEIASMLYEAANPTMRWSYLYPSHNHLHASVRHRFLDAAARFQGGSRLCGGVTNENNP